PTVTVAMRLPMTVAALGLPARPVVTMPHHTNGLSVTAMAVPVHWLRLPVVHGDGLVSDQGRVGVDHRWRTVHNRTTGDHGADDGRLDAHRPGNIPGLDGTSRQHKGSGTQAVADERVEFGASGHGGSPYLHQGGPFAWKASVLKPCLSYSGAPFRGVEAGW